MRDGLAGCSRHTHPNKCIDSAWRPRLPYMLVDPRRTFRSAYSGCGPAEKAEPRKARAVRAGGSAGVGARVKELKVNTTGKERAAAVGFSMGRGGSRCLGAANVPRPRVRSRRWALFRVAQRGTLDLTNSTKIRLDRGYMVTRAVGKCVSQPDAEMSGVRVRRRAGTKKGAMP